MILAGKEIKPGRGGEEATVVAGEPHVKEIHQHECVKTQFCSKTIRATSPLSRGRWSDIEQEERAPAVLSGLHVCCPGEPSSQP